MGTLKGSLVFFFVFFLVGCPSSGLLGAAQARPLPVMNQERYVKVMASLGIMCQCCDGEGGACRSTWDYATATCAKLDCRPWKF
ncbi:hypothetical protein J5N97_002409 [Dioscorea zingiberensis]|uniref:Uncharacterized protein n=1 Tax=Dioscorea zingiberensis TaxID=325984 RepID=A0A9D5D4P9_9LILI|nr:hypothetical protein J5N97_002409 [Dioscorea zingiberensis]